MSWAFQSMPSFFYLEIGVFSFLVSIISREMLINNFFNKRKESRK